MKTQKLTDTAGKFGRWLIDCPGCGMSHLFDKRWSFNGDTERPTFRPSMLARWPENNVCHSFVTDGKINFLNDCTHDLKGKTVELPEIC